MPLVWLGRVVTVAAVPNIRSRMGHDGRTPPAVGLGSAAFVVRLHWLGVPTWGMGPVPTVGSWRMGGHVDGGPDVRWIRLGAEAAGGDADLRCPGTAATNAVRLSGAVHGLAQRRRASAGAVAARVMAVRARGAVVRPARHHAPRITLSAGGVTVRGHVGPRAKPAVIWRLGVGDGSRRSDPQQRVCVRGQGNATAAGTSGFTRGLAGGPGSQMAWCRGAGALGRPLGARA